MSIENPFANFGKVEKTKKKLDQSRLDGARKEGVLNARGRGGPLYEQMVNDMETLGTNDSDSEQVRHIREMFVSKLDRKSTELFNTYVNERKGAPGYDKFKTEAEESFMKGYGYFLKSALRADAAYAPKKYESRYMKMGGGAKMLMSDQKTEADYVRDFITHGNDVVGELDFSAEEHKFEPREDFEGYAKKYEGSDERKSDEQRASENYAFEKMRVYARDYTAMLEEGLKNGLPYKQALNAASHVYGYAPGIIDEMKEGGIEPKVVSWMITQYPAQVRVPLETYLEKGKMLEEQYPYTPGPSSWVSSPNMIRNYIFKYPRTAEAGLRVADAQLQRLKEQFPSMSQRLLIKHCVSDPANFEENISVAVDSADALMAQFATTPELGVKKPTNENIFAYYKVEGAVLRMCDKPRTQHDKQLQTILDKFRDLLEESQQEGLELGYGARHKMLKVLIDYDMAPAKRIIAKEKKRSDARIAKYDELVTKAEGIDEIWGGYFVDVGFGKNNRERLGNGQAVVDIVRETYGDDDAESYLDKCIDLVYAIEQKGFPKSGEAREHLMDAVVMNPYNPKQFYEEVLGQTWPEDVNVIGLDPDSDTV